MTSSTQYRYPSLLRFALFLLLSIVLPVSSQQQQQPQPTVVHSFDIGAALRYVPSKAIGAVGFVIYFTISSALLWRLVRNRDWWGLCLPIGGYCESLGFMVRIFMDKPALRFSLGAYIIMDFFIVLSPAAFLAFNYITYGRLIRNCVGREHSMLRPELVGRSFVASDVVTFLIQASGGSLQVQANLANLGKIIFLTGIIAQGLSYVVYDVLVVHAHRSIRRVMYAKGLDPHKHAWYKVFKLIYFSSLFIIIRSIYRVIETAQGRGGYLLTHEWCFLLFDSIPLAIATGVYIFWWPGDYIPKEVTFSAVNNDYHDGESSVSGIGMIPVSSGMHGRDIK